MVGEGRRGNPVAWAFGALLVLALAAVPVAFERVEEEVDTGPTGLARLDPYHGLAQVLVSLGVPARGSYGVVQAPAHDHTLVLASKDRPARRKLWDRLEPWVDDGGHLVILPPGGATIAWDEVLGDTGAAGHPLDVQDWDVLDSLVIGIVEGEGAAGEGAGEAAASEAAASEAARTIVSPDGRRRLLAAAPGFSIQTQREVVATWWSGDDRPWAVRAPYGDGWITVVSDARPLQNDRLGQADHALLAWELLGGPAGPPAGVTFVLGGESRSLAAIAWRAAGPLVVSCLVMLGLLGWRGAVRTGPVLPDPRPERRDLMEHVAASGVFLWRHDLQDTLLGPARAAVRRRLGLRRGGSLDDAALLDAALADSGASSLAGSSASTSASSASSSASSASSSASAPTSSAPSEQELRAALLDPVPAAPQAFLAVVRTLQQLWRPR